MEPAVPQDRRFIPQAWWAWYRKEATHTEGLLLARDQLLVRDQKPQDDVNCQDLSSSF